MRKLLPVLLAVVLLGTVPALSPALAGGHGGSHSGHGGSHPGHGHIHPGFGVGVLVGPAYVYPYLGPVYVEPLPPTCYTTQGYWAQVPVTPAYGFPTYQNVWVPPQTVCQ